jgi:hypothetical protein
VNPPCHFFSPGVHRCAFVRSWSRNAHGRHSSSRVRCDVARRDRATPVRAGTQISATTTARRPRSAYQAALGPQKSTYHHHRHSCAATKAVATLCTSRALTLPKAPIDLRNNRNNILLPLQRSAKILASTTVYLLRVGFVHNDIYFFTLPELSLTVSSRAFSSVPGHLPLYCYHLYFVAIRRIVIVVTFEPGPYTTTSPVV